MQWTPPPQQRLTETTGSVDMLGYLSLLWWKTSSEERQKFRSCRMQRAINHAQWKSVEILEEITYQCPVRSHLKHLSLGDGPRRRGLLSPPLRSPLLGAVPIPHKSNQHVRSKLWICLNLMEVRKWTYELLRQWCGLYWSGCHPSPWWHVKRQLDPHTRWKRIYPCKRTRLSCQIFWTHTWGRRGVLHLSAHLCRFKYSYYSFMVCFCLSQLFILLFTIIIASLNVHLIAIY